MSGKTPQTLEEQIRNQKAPQLSQRDIDKMFPQASAEIIRSQMGMQGMTQIPAERLQTIVDLGSQMSDFIEEYGSTTLTWQEKITDLVKHGRLYRDAKDFPIKFIADRARKKYERMLRQDVTIITSQHQLMNQILARNGVTSERQGLILEQIEADSELATTYFTQRISEYAPAMENLRLERKDVLTNLDAMQADLDAARAEYESYTPAKPAASTGQTLEQTVTQPQATSQESVIAGLEQDRLRDQARLKFEQINQQYQGLQKQDLELRRKIDELNIMQNAAYSERDANQKVVMKAIINLQNENALLQAHYHAQIEMGSKVANLLAQVTVAQQVNENLFHALVDYQQVYKTMMDIVVLQGDKTAQEIRAFTLQDKWSPATLTQYSALLDQRMAEFEKTRALLEEKAQALADEFVKSGDQSPFGNIPKLG